MGRSKKIQMWAPFPRTRTLERRRNIEIVAGGSKRVGVALPAFLVEINGKEQAGLIAQKRIYTDGLLTGQMVMDRLV